MIAPIAIDHTCLIVRSLAQTRRHWELLFDFSFRPRQGDLHTLVVESPHVHFFITQVPEAPVNFLQLQHISFRVQNLNEVIERLESAGIDDYATGAVDFFAHNNYRWCEWRDPDGIRVECVEIIPSS